MRVVRVTPEMAMDPRIQKLLHDTVASIKIEHRLHCTTRACCANPNPQLMRDPERGLILQCMNCSAFIS